MKPVEFGVSFCEESEIVTALPDLAAKVSRSIRRSVFKYCPLAPCTQYVHK